MDIRDIFKEISEQLLAEFRKTAAVAHSGGKGSLREDAFSDFLQHHLPGRYGVGRGEVITAENRVSGQLDIVIHDRARGPELFTSRSHSIYPIENVYGALSMKSGLDARELKDAYDNIASFKRILPRRTFVNSPSPGFAAALSFPVPVTGIVAYRAGRSLDAIAAQARKLDGELLDIRLRPDFIAVIGVGIVGSRQALRGDFNSYNLPSNTATLTQLRRTERHTLLRLYLEIVRELNAINLCPLNLADYDEMPRLIGPYRVGRHNRFATRPIGGGDDGYVFRLTEQAIVEIVLNSKEVTRKENLLHTFGENIQLLDPASFGNLDATIFEFNPNNLPPIDPNNFEKGNPHPTVPAFIPIWMQIDGRPYAVDISALSEAAGHFERDPDFTVNELLSS